MHLIHFINFNETIANILTLSNAGKRKLLVLMRPLNKFKPSLADWLKQEHELTIIIKRYTLIYLNSK
jgi:hypothetical protein